jgi:hypothetical protein
MWRFDAAAVRLRSCKRLKAFMGWLMIESGTGFVKRDSRSGSAAPPA